MLIIGVDFHSRFQQIAMVDAESGELIERRLDHSNGEAQKFYGELQKPVLWWWSRRRVCLFSSSTSGPRDLTYLPIEDA